MPDSSRLQEVPVILGVCYSKICPWIGGEKHNELELKMYERKIQETGTDSKANCVSLHRQAGKWEVNIF